MENDLRIIRELRGLSIRKLSVLTGINRGKLSEIENGIRRPTLQHILAIEKVLDHEITFTYRIPVDLKKDLGSGKSLLDVEGL